MPPNLLFITTDQQRWDSLPCYGLDFIHTPALDRLASEGTVFQNCIVPAPLCVPCRAAMLSGQYPSTTGVMGNGSWLSDDTPTWSRAASDAGIRTAAIGKMHFNPWDRLGGFQERTIAEDKRHVYLPDDHVKFLQSHGLHRFHPIEKPGYFEGLGASVTPREKRFHIDAFVGDRAAEWIGANGSSPFAAWVSFPGPHDPYDPPEEMADMYYGAPIPEPVGSPDELDGKPPAQRSRGSGSLMNSMYRIDLSRATPDHYRKWRAHYYANITLIDEGIDKILDALDSVGAADDTLVVFTSDHGDALGDHGLPYKGFFYNSMAHVPLIIRGPGAPTGQRVQSLVSTLDLVPLFYQTLDLDPPDTLQGQNLGDLLTNPEGAIRDAVFSENGGRTMVQTNRHKYACYADGSAELYDLETDPDECTNLAGNEEHAAAEAELMGRILRHNLENSRRIARTRAMPQHPLRVSLEADHRRQREREARSTSGTP